LGSNDAQKFDVTSIIGALKNIMLLLRKCTIADGKQQRALVEIAPR
jgi:hypothetical protein